MKVSERDCSVIFCAMYMLIHIVNRYDEYT